MIERSKELMKEIGKDAGVGTIIGGATGALLSVTGVSIFMLLNWQETPEEVCQNYALIMFASTLGPVCEMLTGATIGMGIGVSFGFAHSSYNFFKSLLPAPPTMEERLKKANYFDEVDDRYICPISYQIMQNPMRGSDGRHYEKSSIEKWLRKNATSPFTRRKLTLQPDEQLKNEILSFVQEVEYKNTLNQTFSR